MTDCSEVQGLGYLLQLCSPFRTSGVFAGSPRHFPLSTVAILDEPPFLHPTFRIVPSAGLLKTGGYN